MTRSVAAASRAARLADHPRDLGALRGAERSTFVVIADAVEFVEELTDGVRWRWLVSDETLGTVASAHATSIAHTMSRRGDGLSVGVVFGRTVGRDVASSDGHRPSSPVPGSPAQVVETQLGYDR